MIRMLAQRDFIRQGVSIHVSMLDVERRTVSALTDKEYGLALYSFEPVEQGTMHPPAPFMLDPKAAQELMDTLYDAGLRPTGAQGTAGQLEAMKAHLEDMRKLAFEKLKDKPKQAQAPYTLDPDTVIWVTPKGAIRAERDGTGNGVQLTAENGRRLEVTAQKNGWLIAEVS